MVTPDDLMKALGVDAELEAARKDAIMLWVFKVKAKSDLESVEALPIAQVEHQLSNLHIKRFFS